MDEFKMSGSTMINMLRKRLSMLLAEYVGRADAMSSAHVWKTKDRLITKSHGGGLPHEDDQNGSAKNHPRLNQ